jgi:hypothetical protein
MSMSQDHEDFKSLRQLLVLKRYEQPPPGYFNDFSSQVIDRIKAGDRVDENIFARLSWEAPWLQSLWSALETKPILAGAFGVAVCGLLVWGVVFADRVDVQPLAAIEVPRAAEPGLVLTAQASASDEPLRASSVLAGNSEKSPMAGSLATAEPSSGIFDLIPMPKASPASATLRLDLAPGN